MQKQNYSRRDFLGHSAMALLAGVAIQVVGCSDSTSSSSNVGPGDKEGVVGAPIHGHAAIITKAELDAGGAADIHIQAGAGHDHIVSLTADDMTAVKAGTKVSVESSVTNSHSHTVSFN